MSVIWIDCPTDGMTVSPPFCVRGGFLTGPAMIDGLVTAIRRAKGSTRGIVLAAQLEKFRGVPTLSGKISFSRNLNSVFGRTYRVMRIQNNQMRYVGAVKAKVVVRIG